MGSVEKVCNGQGLGPGLVAFGVFDGDAEVALGGGLELARFVGRREADFRMTPERKAELQRLLFEEKLLPAFEGIRRVNRADGVKCYFEDGSWVICRFSGTEPLLRMAAEAEDGRQAEALIEKWRELLSL